MANIKWASTLYSNRTNTQWRVDIHDTSFSGTATQIKLLGEGFDLTYLQQGDEIYSPVKGSECKVYLAVTKDATGVALETWLYGTMLTNIENRYQIAIYKSGDLFWFGNMLPDLSGRQDAPRPYQFMITATDGLARLKDFEFDFGMADYGGYATYIEFLYACLKHTPLYLANSYLSNTILFETSVDWYEDQMDARADNKDPLDMSRVHSFTFKPFLNDGDTERTPMSCHEVLEYICRAWGMRIIMSKGVFLFVQVGQYENEGTSKWWRLYTTSSGVFDTAISFNAPVPLNVTSTSYPRVLSGNQWNYFAALKYVYLNFQFGKNLNMLDGDVSLPYPAELNDYLAGGTGTRLNFTSRIYVATNIVNHVNTFPVFVNVEITISLGGSDWYLKKAANGTASWSSTPAVYISQFSFTMIPANSGFQGNYFTIFFTTPDIPAGVFDNNLFNIRVVSVTLAGPLFTSVPHTAVRVAGSTSLKYNASSDNEDTNYITYQGANVLGIVNSYDLTLPDSIMGEMFQPNFFGGIFTGPVGGPFTRSSGLWSLFATGLQNNFNMMLVKQVFSAQTLPVEKYQGSIVGVTVEPDTVFTYNGQEYILNGGTFSAASETWQGEWFKTTYHHASFTAIRDAVLQTGDNGTYDLRTQQGAIQSSLGFEIQTKGSYYNTTGVSDTTGGSNSHVFLGLGVMNWIAPNPIDMNPNYDLSSVITVKNASPTGGDVLTIIGTIDGVANPTLNQYESLTFMSSGLLLYKIQ